MNDSMNTAPAVESTAGRKLSRKESVALILAAVLIIAAGFYTLSKYSADRAAGATVELEDFYAVTKVYTVDTDGDGNKIYTKTTGGNYVYDNETSSYVFSYCDTDDDTVTRYSLTRTQKKLTDDGVIQIDVKDFGDTQLDFVYTGEAMTYCRFKVDVSFLQEFSTDTDSETGVTRTQTVPHEYAKTSSANTYGTDVEGKDIYIYDNTKVDGWYYITGIMTSDTTLEDVLDITSVGKDVYDLLDGDESEYVEIVVTVDCVQFNRAKALWGIDENDDFPWETS